MANIYEILTYLNHEFAAREAEALRRGAEEQAGIVRQKAAIRALQKELEEFRAGDQISASEITRLGELASKNNPALGGDIAAIIAVVIRDAYHERMGDLKDQAEKIQYYNAQKTTLRSRLWRVRVVAISLVALLAGLVAALIIGGGDEPARQAEIDQARDRIEKEKDAAARQFATGVVGGTTTASQAASGTPEPGETTTPEGTGETGNEATQDYGGVAPAEGTGDTGADESTEDYGGVDDSATDGGPIVK